MNLTKTNKKEIGALYAVLNELEWLHKDLQRTELDGVDWDDYKVLSTMGTNMSRGLDLDTERNPEFFLEDLVRHLSGIHFQRILTNLECLLDNCADPDRPTLDYNADIKKGLELLRAWTDAEPGRRVDFPVERVKHAELDRVGDSLHTSQCPSCTPGTLAMRRDPATFALLAEDACLHCGQRVLYTDVVEGKLVETQEAA